MKSLKALSLMLIAFIVGCPPGPDDGDDGDNGGNDPNNIAAGDISELSLREPISDPSGDVPAEFTLTRIAATGDAVPDIDGATFLNFGAPLIDARGRVAFFASWRAASSTGAGLYVWQDGKLTRVIDSDPEHTPDVLADGDVIDGIDITSDGGSPHMAWGAGDRLLFAAHLNDSPQPNALFRWRASDGDLLLITDCPTFAEALPDATEAICEFYHPGVSDSGIATFSQRFSFFREDGSFSLFNFGLFSTNGRGIRRYARGAVPEQPAAARFDDPVLLTAINPAGDRLFQAKYTGGAGSRGVFLHRDGRLYRALDNAPNRSFEGLGASATVNAGDQPFTAIALGPRGHIAVDTAITLGGTSRDTVLLWNAEQWRELQGDGSAFASALLTGVNDAGEVAYLAGGLPYLGDGQSRTNLAADIPSELIGVPLTWEAFGGSINNRGGVLLRYRRTAVNTPGLAMWTGDQLLVVADVTRPIGGETFDTLFSSGKVAVADADRAGTLNDRPEVDRPGRSGALNDDFEFCFRAGFLGASATDPTDDRQAIFLGRAE